MLAAQFVFFSRKLNLRTAQPQTPQYADVDDENGKHQQAAHVGTTKQCQGQGDERCRSEADADIIYTHDKACREQEHQCPIKEPCRIETRHSQSLRFETRARVTRS